MVEINPNPAVHPEYSFKEHKEVLKSARCKEVDGVTVYDTGDEFVFYANNERGKEVEHRMAKKEKIALKDVPPDQWPSRDETLRAVVNFPNSPLKEALKKLKELDKKNKK